MADGTRRVTKLMQCSRCNWRIQLTGDDEAEVYAFLVTRLKVHLALQHPVLILQLAQRDIP
jgi:hypothetical protein